MKLHKIFIAACALMAFSACDSYLDPAKDGKLEGDDVWNETRRVFGFLNTAYTNLPNGYHRIDNAMLAAASDEAMHSNLTSSIRAFNNGTWGPYHIVENVWSKNYDGIRRVNYFLEKIDLLEFPKKPTQLGAEESLIRTRERMKGEARFLRAYFYFELVKRYGGVPLILKTLSIDEASKVKRASLDECMQQIVADCDSAYNRLPKKYPEGRNSVPGYDDKENVGRATKGASSALKSRAYLYWASPLNDPEGTNKQRYRLAALAANEVFDTNAFSLMPFGANETHTNLFVPVSGSSILMYHKESVFSTSYNINNTEIERNNTPVSLGGKGYTSPTQNLVDAFGMANGKAIDELGSGYMADGDPYANRDPRFYSSILYNNQVVTMNDKTTTLETFEGGADAKGAFKTSTRTGYYLKKMLSSSAVWDGRTNNINRTWLLIRLAEVELNYAEAMNEFLNAPSDSVFKLVENVRQRAGLNPYRVDRSLSQEQMRDLIRRERQVEFCFEEHRFFDIRRWRLMDNPIQRANYNTIKGVKIKRNEDGAAHPFTYEIYTEETRVWNDRMYRYPIPQTEIQKAPAIVQNPGW